MTNEELEKRIKRGIEYRSMTMQVRIANEGESEPYTVEGYATTFEQEYPMGECEMFRLFEKVDRNAFAGCDESDVIMQYDHEGHVYARISNGTLKLEEDEHGKKIVAYLGGTEDGRKLYEEIKGGYTNKMSFGISVSEWAEEERTGADGKLEVIDIVKKISKLWDVSAVSLPANDNTTISARNRFNAEVEKRAAEVAEKEESLKLAEEEKKHQAEIEKATQEREKLALELEISLSL